MSAYDFIDTLAVQILTYKKEHNETATQFAKGCGVSAATIRRIENGDANVKLSTADKLLRYMNITLIDLLPPLAITFITEKINEMNLRVKIVFQPVKKAVNLLPPKWNQVTMCLETEHDYIFYSWVTTV